MRLSPSVDRIIATSTHPIYVDGRDPSPSQSEFERLPRPVEEWLEARYPKVEVGRLCYPQKQEPQPSVLGSQGQRIRAAVFILGFNAEQAEAFIADWSYSPSRLPKSPDFYLVRCTPKQLGALIHWHVLHVRQRLLGRLRNLMQATTYEPTNHSKENHRDSTHFH